MFIPLPPTLNFFIASSSKFFFSLPSSMTPPSHFGNPPPNPCGIQGMGIGSPLPFCGCYWSLNKVSSLSVFLLSPLTCPFPHHFNSPPLILLMSMSYHPFPTFVCLVLSIFIPLKQPLCWRFFFLCPPPPLTFPSALALSPLFSLPSLSFPSLFSSSFSLLHSSFPSLFPSPSSLSPLPVFFVFPSLFPLTFISPFLYIF
ncbi:unnamed protein product [Acanthosepion pharaonis]|uniref:Uncharacterized protein n=1 Tax=Acanthosepion pharaonis TaxID=158019 RepID=A0A812BNM2_ACAPH|nr:unnamed protein product [Sepia pharaonis]